VDAFELRSGRCLHCQTPIAGRFDDSAGEWRGNRLPIKISN
jgi:hypothetical protein